MMMSDMLMMMMVSFLCFCGWLGGAKVSCIFCHPGRPADIGL